MIKGKLIGSGATADVFDWTENTIIKIFNDYQSDDAIDQEINNTKALQNCSFNFPRFIQKLQYEGKNAIVYEKIVGTSMLKQLELNNKRHILKNVFHGQRILLMIKKKSYIN